MNIQDVINEYIKNRNTDYAILLNGQWGIGKTYFIQKSIIPRLKIDFSSRKIIYVSMNGLSSIEGFKRVLLYSYLSKNNNLGDSVVNTILDTGSSIDSFFIKDISNIFRFSKELFERNKIKNIDAKNTILIIDDLERISKKIRLEDVFGTIYDILLSKGGKTIFVAFEDELKKMKKKYELIKEKYIRYDFAFVPNMDDQINNYLEINGDDSDYTKYIRDRKKQISSIMEKSDHRNLRTFSFFYELFKKPYLLLLKLTDKVRVREAIFSSALIIVIEYKKGNAGKIENELSEIKGLMYGSEKSNDYMNGFKNHYIDILGLQFNYVDSIIKYILHGIFDEEIIEKEIRSHFYFDFLLPAAESDEFKSLRKISNFRNIENDELVDSIKQTLVYAKKGIYPAQKYIEIYSFTKYLIDKNYTSVITVEELIEIIKNGFAIAIERTKDELDESSIFMIEQSYNQMKNDPLVAYFLTKLREQYDKAKIGKEGEKIKALFVAANTSDDEFRSILFSLNGLKIFENIVKTGSQTLLSSLNNQGIYWIESLIEEITRTYNAKQTYSSQIPYLNVLCEQFKILAELKDNDSLRKRRYIDCVEATEEAIKHIENAVQ